MKIKITLPENLQESNIKQIIDLLNKSMDGTNGGSVEIIIDFGKITKVDFFGYQVVFCFCISFKDKFLSLTVENKPAVMAEFEKKMGLTIQDY